MNVDLDSENGITQSGAITATSLDVTNTVDGDVVLDQNNDVATVAITNTVGDVTYTTISSSITDINGIQGVNIVLNTDNGVSQSAAITATNSLTVTNAVSGNVVLDQNNDVVTVAIANAVGDVTYNTNRATTTDIAGIQGVNVDLNSENGITQSGAITATSLDVTNTVDGDVVLANASNDVGSLSVINTGRAITYFDSDDLIVTQLDGSPITITAGGSVSQVNDISGTDLTVTANGSINLSNPNNSISTVALSSRVITATAEATLDGNAIDSTVSITNGGRGYAPSLTTIPVAFSDSPTGDTATGVANSDINGVITSITVTHPGSGYTTAPTITIDAGHWEH